MTLVNESIGGVILLLFAVGVAFEVYRYIKGHPQTLSDLKAKVAGLEASASADWAALHSKVDSLITKVDATHAAALAPVTVTVVPATPAQSAASTPPTQTPPPATVVFDPAQYPNPAERAAAMQQMMAKYPYPTQIVAPSGNPVTAAGNEIVPTGTGADMHTGTNLGTSFGFWLRSSVQTGKSTTFTFGPFTVDTKVRVGTVEAPPERGQMLGIDVVDANNLLQGSGIGNFKAECYVPVTCLAGMVYRAMVSGRDPSGWTDFDIQLYQG